MSTWKRLGGMAVIFLLAACHTGNDKASMLDKPPFAALTDSIKQYPDDTQLLLRRAEMLSQHNLHELAFNDYTQAWRRDSSENVAMAYISNLFLVNKPMEAMRLLDNSIKRFPNNPDFRRRLSEAYLQSGQSGEALAQYDNILKADSTNFEAWYERGMLLTEMGDTANAINALARSYALQPLSMNGVMLANLYAETKDPRAIEIADQLIQKDSTSESLDPYYIKGIYYSNMKQYPQALEQFDKCIAKDWKFTDAYLEKGIILYEEKNIDESLQTFKMANTVSPANPDAYFWQGRCYESAGKKEEAIESYAKAYALDKSFTEAKERMDKLRNR